MDINVLFSHCALYSAIFSLDVRRGRAGRHWWNEQRFGRRVRFLLPSSTGAVGPRNTTTLARLQIVNVTRQDGGEYRCRVDFNNAPSRNFKYRLVVIGEFLSFFLFTSTRVAICFWFPCTDWWPSRCECDYHGQWGNDAVSLQSFSPTSIHVAVIMFVVIPDSAAGSLFVVRLTNRVLGVGTFCRLHYPARNFP